MGETKLKDLLSRGLDAKYIPNYEELSVLRQVIRQAGFSLSMTQGVFDLLHEGHLRYIAKARSQGDLLLVAVDSDAYTRKRKQGDNERRPIVTYDVRLEMLQNLRTVDILTVRDLDKHEDDPDFVIKLVQPDVLVMSHSTKDISDSKYDEIRAMCESWGGRLEIFQPQAVTTTTATIRELAMDGATGLSEHVVASINEYMAKGGRTVNFGGNGGNTK